MIGTGGILLVGQTIKMVVHAGSWSFALQVVAFVLGGGGMMVMFHRWRLAGDTIARAQVLIAFGLWASSVGVASVTDDGHGPGVLAYLFAGLALLIGFLGGISALARMHLERQENDDFGPPPSSGTDDASTS